MSVKHSKRIRSEENIPQYDNAVEPYLLDISEDRQELDRTNLLKVFPREVWIIISEKLDPSNLEKFSNSSLFLRELLLPQRVQFLFKNVWGVLGTKYENKFFSRKDFFPILSLRRVCRSWNNVLESFYQHLPNGTFLGKCIWDLTCNMTKQKEFIESLANDSFYLTTTRNPFFSRSLELPIPYGTADNFFDKCLSVLESYGHHLWYCIITVVDGRWFNAQTELYSKIRSILEQMPNLKVLGIANHTYLSLFHSENQVVELEAEISSRAFPTFKDLQELRINSVPTLVVQDLMRQNSHVHTLKIRNFDEYVKCNMGNLPLLHNLSMLSIQFSTEMEFLKFTKRQVAWPLAKLHLEFYSYFPRSAWQEVFDVLHDRFASTLTHLTLWTPKKESGNIARIQKLDLPNLTHLDLKMHTLENVDFLLPLQNSLKVLKLHVRLPFHSVKKVMVMAGKVEIKSVIKLFSLAPKTKSNIWTVLPQLQQLDFYFSGEDVRLLELKETRGQIEGIRKVGGNK